MGMGMGMHPESYEHRFCNCLTALVRKTSAGVRNNASMRYVESYITKNEHGYGFGCLPSWLYVERRPCSLAMRAG